MLFSYNWLKEYLEEVLPPEELADRLTMTGTEIESVTKTGAAFTNVVTAQVVACEKHPNADKLSVCRVATGSEELQIVCGAKNMKPGDKVALALVGAELPGDFKIKKSKIRGVESFGMMCSEVELGLKDTSDGIMILPGDTPLGSDFSGLIGSDCMMEAGVTPNRADLLSIKGIAREVSAITGARLKERTFPLDEAGRQAAECATIGIADGAPCGKYAARVVEGVTIGPSPENIRQRLEAHGIRSINNVVDVTNLVLLETGQPLHAFDLDKLKGSQINVRLSKTGEKIETIDGKIRELEPSMLVIADAENPVAVAGVMGGKGSEVTDKTVNILIESAWFEPSSVRRTSKKLGLSTDSSYRFERGVDFAGVEAALDMAAHLINQHAGGRVAKGLLRSVGRGPETRQIEFRTTRSNDLLGIDIPEKEAVDILNRLHIMTESGAAGTVLAKPPSFRMDLGSETDLIEEVARVFGYNNIKTTMPYARLDLGNPGALSLVRRRAKELLADTGFTEVVNYSFVSRDSFALAGDAEGEGITILNPITEEQVVMRQSLIPSLLDNLKFNLARKSEEVRIFEFAPAFVPGKKLPDEIWKASGLMYGPRFEPGWSFPKDWVDFYDVKGVIERLIEKLGIEGAKFEAGSHPFMHPGKTAVLKIGTRKAGSLGELHPDLWPRFDLRRPAYIFELEAGALADSFGRPRKYAQLPKFPESERDIAFIIDEAVPFSEIISLIEGLDAKLIEKVELFDVYYGGNIPQGKRSLAIRVTYRSMERTLTNQEVEDIHSRVVKELTDRLKAEIRG